MITAPSIRDRLRPYLPRLTLEWLAKEPTQQHRSVEGSMVFVDISGFTALSEKLAKLGRVGAEEMADAIDTCFSELLVLAYEQDGSLLKFGGDALLLMFSGDDERDHALRAARAAIGMRRRLREVGTIQTPAGRVRLRMSVGVHTGVFDVFLVGGSHRELLLAGPATTQVVAMEAAADAGEIVVSPATAALLPARSVGDAKPPGSILRSINLEELAGPVSVVPEVDDDLLNHSVPVAIRESLLAGIVEPEHRQVAIAFIHFDGTDELIAREGPAVMAAELDRLVHRTQTAVDEVGVSFLASDVDADGGKLILCAGAPKALGDDEERLLLALRSIVEDPDRRIPIKVGVNHGSVFAGDIGPRYRRTYTVMGDAVNLAARLMARAPAGEVYASGSILERSATRFEANELEPFLVKGKAQPVRAWSLGPPIGRRRPGSAEEYPLHGRRGEMRVLRTAQRDAMTGQRRTIVIEAEAGVGKSRILDELLKGCGGFRYAGATGETFTATTPYVAWRDVLRDLIGVGWDDPSEVVTEHLRGLCEEADESLLPWLPLIATALDADIPLTPEVEVIEPALRRGRLHQVVIDFLRAIRTEPTLLAFDDAQLMDEASADLLTAITSDERTDRPWLIVVLRRPTGEGFVPPDHPTTTLLELEPLSTEAARELAQAVTDDQPLAAHVMQQVVERSQGNPQLLLDLAHMALQGEDRLPDSVEAAATVRIDSLSPHDRVLVRRVSVFGLAFHPRFLEDVLPHDEPRPDDATWERLAEFFEPEGGGYIRFRRSVVRDAAYEGLPFRTRRRLHLAVGRHLERVSPNPEENAGLLSLHFALAAEHAEAWMYARIAANRALAIYANVEAISLYERALGSGRRVEADREELRRAYENLGLAQMRSGLYAEARRSFADAHRHADLPVPTAEMMLRRAYIEEYVGSYPRALGWLTRAHRVLDGVSGPEAEKTRIEIGYRRAAVLYNVGRAAEAAERARATIEQAEAIEADEVLGSAHNVLGNALSWLGDAGAEHELREALRIYERQGWLPGQAMVLLNLGAAAYWEGRWDDATALYRQALDLHTRTANPVEAAFAGVNIAEILLEQGRLEEAEALLRDASRSMRASGEIQGLASSLGFLGRVSARAGRLDEAFDRFEQARSTYAQAGMKAGIYEIDAREAERLVMDGRSDEALALAGSTLARSADDVGIELLAPMLERTRAYASAQKADLDAARSAADRSLALATERGAPYEVALTKQAIARLDALEGRSTARDVAEETREIFERLGVIATPCYPMVGGPSFRTGHRIVADDVSSTRASSA